MDEYLIEISEVRRELARRKAEEAPPPIIEEYEAQLHNLVALYQAARETFDHPDPRLRRALAELGFGEWNLANVYSFVYEAAMAAEDDGRALANVITHTDYVASLLAALQAR